MLDTMIELKQETLEKRLKGMKIETNMVFYGSVGAYRKVALPKAIADRMEYLGLLAQIGLDNEIEPDLQLTGGSRCFII